MRSVGDVTVHTALPEDGLWELSRPGDRQGIRNCRNLLFDRLNLHSQTLVDQWGKVVHPKTTPQKSLGAQLLPQCSSKCP